MSAAGNTFFFEWEVRLMEWLQQVFGEGTISVISALSMFGETMMVVVILGFIYWCWDKEYGKFIGLNVLTANVWNPMIKNVFLRRRPYFDNSSIKILRVVEPEADIYDITAQGYSFPSGHSTCAAAVYGSMPLYKKGKKLLLVPAFLLPLLVGFSRVVVGAHYPTDVLAGWALGVIAILVLPVLQRAIKSRAVFYLILFLATVPGVFYCTSADYYTSFGLLLGFFAAVPFEERFVRFENTRSPIRCILRLVGGGAVFFGLNALLKMPFSHDFLESGTKAALLVRMGRYALVAFIDFSVYPILFRYTAGIGAKKKLPVR